MPGGSFSQKTWNNGASPALNANNLNYNEVAIKALDDEWKYSANSNFFNNKRAYFGDNVRELYKFLSDEYYDSSSNIDRSMDYTNFSMHDRSYKIAKNTSSDVNMSITWDIPSTSIATFPSGAAASDDDIIVFSFYESDNGLSEVDGFTLHFGQDSSNYYSMAVEDYQGWNCVYAKISTLSTTGSPTKTGIVWMQIVIDTNSGYEDEYVSLQWLGMVRDSSTKTGYPNPIQESDGDATPAWVDSWSTDEDPVIMYYDEYLDDIMLMTMLTDYFNDPHRIIDIEVDYINFVVKAKFYPKVSDANETGFSLMWFVDDDNYTRAYVSSGVLYLEVYQGGVSNNKSVTLGSIFEANQEIDMIFEKKDDKFRVEMYSLDNNTYAVLDAETTISATAEGRIYIGQTDDVKFACICDLKISNTRLGDLQKANNSHEVMVMKPVDTSRDNTTTNIVDPHLQIMNLRPNSIYEVDFLGLVYCSSTTPDIKIAWIISSHIDFILGDGRATLGMSTSATDATNATMTLNNYVASTSVHYGTDDTGEVPFREKIILRTGNTVGGMIQVFWSQRVSSASATVLHAGSYVKARRIGSAGLLERYK